MEGGIIFGLSAALDQEITLVNGVVQQTNYDTFPSLRMHEVPEIVVEILQSDEPPTGVGEPGLPPIAAAVANAIHTLTGVRLRTMPLQRAWNERGVIANEELCVARTCDIADRTVRLGHARSRCSMNDSSPSNRAVMNFTRSLHVLFHSSAYLALHRAFLHFSLDDSFKHIVELLRTHPLISRQFDQAAICAHARRTLKNCRSITESSMRTHAGASIFRMVEAIRTRCRKDQSRCSIKRR